VIALRADHRRAFARRPAVEAAVAAGDDGRPDASLGKPALRKDRLPTGLPHRLGLRFAPSTATWKTSNVFHSCHSLDDEPCTKMKPERRRRNPSRDRLKRTLHQHGLSLSPEHQVSAFLRNRCPLSSVSAHSVGRGCFRPVHGGVRQGWALLSGTRTAGSQAWPESSSTKALQIMVPGTLFRCCSIDNSGITWVAPFK
jgi:hypothetical protein